MAKGEYLGELELVVLIAVARLDPEAYGMTIRREVLDTTGRDISVPAVYMTLSRLLTKGMLTSRMGAGTEKRGGRPKKYFELTRSGALALQSSRSMFDALWNGVSLDPYLR